MPRFYIFWVQVVVVIEKLEMLLLGFVQGELSVVKPDVRKLRKENELPPLYDVLGQGISKELISDVFIYL
jgi:hypothetical protein